MHLSEIHVYPVKSCGSVRTDVAAVEPRGLAQDRRWMVVDEAGGFLTGRTHPRMPLISPKTEGATLELAAPGMPAIRLESPATGEQIPVKVWDSLTSGHLAGPEADQWVSDYLGVRARLVWMAPSIRRPVEPAFSQPGDLVGFADSFPVMAISQASLDGLNARMERPVSMLRFRPNLVVAGTTAHEEDHWKRIRIGAVDFDVAKSCTRCNFVNVDPLRGERDATGEPLRTLAKYRKVGSKIHFGRHLIARSAGSVRVGDPVLVLA
jgi:uncharacterized protein